MKAVVIYKGTFGSTKQYAEWIADALGFPCYSVEAFPAGEASTYELFVIGSAVRMSALAIKDWLGEMMPKLMDRPVFLFSVSGTGPEEKELLQQILDNSCTDAIQKHVHFYPLRGRQKFSQFPWIARIILKIASRFERDPKRREGMITDYDYVARENIDPLVNEIRQVLSKS